MRGHIFQRVLTFTLGLALSVTGVLSCPIAGSREPGGAETRAALIEARLERVEVVLEERARRIGAADRARIAEELTRADLEHGLDALLLLALIDQESRYDPRARGPRGSLGLMQIRPFVGADVARRYGIPWGGPATLVDPVLNVRIGIAYLAEMRQMYGKDELALAAYNMGPYRVKRILANGREPRSRYAALVLDGYQALRQRFLSEVGAAAF